MLEHGPGFNADKKTLDICRTTSFALELTPAENTNLSIKMILTPTNPYCHKKMYFPTTNLLIAASTLLTFTSALPASEPVLARALAWTPAGNTLDTWYKQCAEGQSCQTFLKKDAGYSTCKDVPAGKVAYTIANGTMCRFWDGASCKFGKSGKYFNQYGTGPTLPTILEGNKSTKCMTVTDWNSAIAKGIVDKYGSAFVEGDAIVGAV